MVIICVGNLLRDFGWYWRWKILLLIMNFGLIIIVLCCFIIKWFVCILVVVIIKWLFGIWIKLYKCVMFCFGKIFSVLFVFLIWLCILSLMIVIGLIIRLNWCIVFLVIWVICRVCRWKLCVFWDSCFIWILDCLFVFFVFFMLNWWNWVLIYIRKDFFCIWILFFGLNVKYRVVLFRMLYVVNFCMNWILEKKFIFWWLILRLGNFEWFLVLMFYKV